MSQYAKILVCVELNLECDELVVKKAVEVAQEFSGKITLLHVVENLAGYGAVYGISAGTDVEQALVDNARQELSKLGIRYNILPSQQLVKIGTAKSVILDEAEHLGANLIILGSHGRHGLRLLLGSTANAILHNARCDVLAVRVKD